MPCTPYLALAPPYSPSSSHMWPLPLPPPLPTPNHMVTLNPTQSQVRRITNGRYGDQRGPGGGGGYRDDANGYHSSHRSSSSSQPPRGGGGEGGGGGGGGGYSRGPALQSLPPEQRALAEQLCEQHAPHLRPEHFDEGVVGSLGRLSTADGLAVLRELGANQLGGVRNMASYIMGIVKRHLPGGGRR